jgi:hypothetical protein
MSTKICFDKYYFINIIIIILIIILYFHYYYIYNNNNNTNIKYKEEDKKEIKEENKVVYIQNNSGNNDNNGNYNLPYYNNNLPYNNSNNNLPYNNINSIDRIYNPLRFPVKSTSPFNYGQCGDSLNNNYNNINPINNPYTINYRTRPYCDQIQQLGAISKVNGDQNNIYPLFGRQKMNNRNQYEYYTMVNGVKLITKPKSNYQELDNNDIISVNQLYGDFLVSVYNNESLF